MPTAILVGWLGCQPKYIRPYERLYEDLGFNVVTILAEPRCIMEAALRSDVLRIPELWPAVEKNLQGPLKMQDLAWKLLGRLHCGQDFPLLFHVFSNGGCFLWESIRKVLSLHKNRNCPQLTQRFLRTIEGRIRGIVFDSSPCWFDDGSTLSAALKYCSESEQKAIKKEFGLSASTREGGQTMKVQYETTRCSDYFGYLRNDQLDIVQLYLCSKNDPLCDFEKVLELVAQRQSKQTCSVKVQFWNKSQHCSHLRNHPKSYKEAINHFLKLSIHHSRL